MFSYLCVLAFEGAAVYIECAVKLAKIVERFAVGSPYRVAVFAVEGSKLLKLVATFKPYVTCYRRAVMLAPLVLITLVVHIQHVTLVVDVKSIHCYFRE